MYSSARKSPFVGLSSIKLKKKTYGDGRRGQRFGGGVAAGSGRRRRRRWGRRRRGWRGTAPAPAPRRRRPVAAARVRSASAAAARVARVAVARVAVARVPPVAVVAVAAAAAAATCWRNPESNSAVSVGNGKRGQLDKKTFKSCHTLERAIKVNILPPYSNQS